MNHECESGCLRLSVKLDNDGTADLIAVATANGFAGRGSACFNVSDLRDFAAGIAKHPLEDPVTIAGGYYSKDVPRKLDQIHLSVRVYLLDGRGQLGVRVELTDSYQFDDRMDSVHSVALEIRTTYNRLERFSGDFLGLIDGRTTEAVLEEERL